MTALRELKSLRPAPLLNFVDYEATGESTALSGENPRAVPRFCSREQREASGGPGGGNEPPVASGRGEIFRTDAGAHRLRLVRFAPIGPAGTLSGCTRLFGLRLALTPSLPSIPGTPRRPFVRASSC